MNAAPLARILVVDDEEAVAAALVDILRYAGYTASAAHNAEEAIGAVAAASVDLAILDVHMPGASGLELAAVLRERFEVPFVFVTGADDQPIFHRAAELGALTYLIKPLRAHQLLPTVASALARARELRASHEHESELVQALHDNRAIGVAVG